VKIETDFKEDKTARSKAYYAKHENVGITLELIDALKQNARLCLHREAGDSFHQMLILEFAGKEFPPHRHPTKSEGYHILEGEMDLVLYDETGNPTQRFSINAKSPIARVGPSTFHSLIVKSPFAIYLESKPGPFNRETDKIMAPWLK
jgi:cupin fold WbuC family metalloprotein